MAWVSSGTVTVTNGNATVTGAGNLVKSVSSPRSTLIVLYVAIGLNSS